ncbi:uncharacterized protein I303_100052 [Kwoniella dejecticola CBS 10117]|uniref:Dolichol-phosphate mannosyltransferase n=1 Tax=Kwoniella dejecticola CBS 10117 TaxID=1296121 RepID=A0A1A6ADU3_9TREE|nr:dolichol-phosphate mannosyltransferase [Kwoniella dejecticola CBS 10117]OBR88241.1 dolichol-phosphate mannosyltransferase [Kwoniella dejecticola CBS 10117]
MSLSGTLTTFQAGPWKFPVFTSGALDSDKAVAFIGGLTNGLGAVPFTYPLSEAVGKAGWRFVQFHWSSAYGGYGTGSLKRDNEEIEALVKHLRSTGVKTLILAGHSTGSQNVMQYLSNPIYQTSSAESDALRIEGGIMQAPASDREFLELLGLKEWFEVLPLAEEMIRDGRGEELMPKEFCESAGFGGVPLPITAYRVHSLIGVGGDDDYFSDDIPVEAQDGYKHSLSSSFGKLSAPALVLYSEEDVEYQKGDVQTKFKRWEDASNGKLQLHFIKNASHDVVQPEAQKVLCEHVIEWLKKFE